MNKKIVVAGIAAVLVVGGGVLFSRKGGSPQQGERELEKTAEKVEEAVGETSVVVVPSDIKKITDELRQQYQNQICQKEDKLYCEYYTRLDKKTGKKRIKNLERTSLCAVVRGLGHINSDLYEYETIGYEEKPCYQGMYAK